MNSVSFLFDGIGLLGTFLYFLSYGLLSAGKIDGNSARYIMMNMIAACCVMVSLVNSWNLPSFVIQFGWIFVSLFGLYRLRRAKHLVGLGPVEKTPEA